MIKKIKSFIFYFFSISFPIFISLSVSLFLTAFIFIRGTQNLIEFSIIILSICFFINLKFRRYIFDHKIKYQKNTTKLDEIIFIVISLVIYLAIFLLAKIYLN